MPGQIGSGSLGDFLGKNSTNSRQAEVQPSLQDFFASFVFSAGISLCLPVTGETSYRPKYNRRLPGGRQAPRLSLNSEKFAGGLDVAEDLVAESFGGGESLLVAQTM